MKYIIILSLFLVSCSKKMCYSFSPFVTEEIRKATSEMEKISPQGNYIQFFCGNDEKLVLVISSVQRGSKFFDNIIKKTNRYVNIRGKKIPIIFSLDVSTNSLTDFDKLFFRKGGILLEIDTVNNIVISSGFMM